MYHSINKMLTISFSNIGPFPIMPHDTRAAIAHNLFLLTKDYLWEVKWYVLAFLAVGLVLCYFMMRRASCDGYLDAKKYESRDPK